MAKAKELYGEITALYDEQELSAEEISAILNVPQDVVEQVIVDYEQLLDSVYGAY
jgi:DNA-directed RNA polymerase specialized sigma24 family protein